MTYKCKIVDDSKNIIAVYYKKGNFVMGKLVCMATGKYYAGEDGQAYPVLLSGKGIWTAVINRKRQDILDNVICYQAPVNTNTT